jgi:hypothetical protein
VSTTRSTALNQLLAVRKGIRSEVTAAAVALHRDSQKMPLLNGFTKTYRRINEDDPELPGESLKLQLRVSDLLGMLRDQYVRLWDLTATIDVTNCEARGTVVVGEHRIEAPVSFLLFLEKQLGELHEFIAKLPILDPSENWKWAPTANAWMTDRFTTVRSKKVPRNHVLAEATDKHAAQVQIWHEDVPVGYWDTVKFSGAIPAEQKNQLLVRVSEVRQAVKMAREEANMAAVRQTVVADALFDHIFAEQPVTS